MTPEEIEQIRARHNAAGEWLAWPREAQGVELAKVHLREALGDASLLLAALSEAEAERDELQEAVNETLAEGTAGLFLEELKGWECEDGSPAYVIRLVFSSHQETPPESGVPQ